MDHKDSWEAEDGELLRHSIHALALLALESALLHLFRFNKCLQALTQFNLPSYTHSFAGERHTEVHIVIECVALILADPTFEFVHELAGEEIRNNRVVPCLVVLPPFFALLVDWEIVEIEFLIWRLLRHSVELFVNPIQKEAKELLRVLLPVS